ncbi:hypothetical protein CYLTODRAFT_445888 [Cylindrobasidium torrendii FP15055 ss-10]|uniref:Uncharacterized protein n=1 Tax=Cylindrobasidium torrendii FP15055 ss-10 TaxID=1314674 RepID=A0A0D7B1W2_9AGAR|nr:hypothetical protein CYLTODRAFT_445888 [Cylindrobasidium torrendii FP15055 ss-10]
MGSNPGSDSPLRRRMHVLERAHAANMSNHSSLSAQAGSPPYSERGRRPAVVEDDDYVTDESASGSTEYSDAEANTTQATSPPPSPTMHKGVHFNDSEEDSLDELQRRATRKRKWYQFDMAVIIALISPLGNLLTGGDLVKNLVYVLLLLFYLHQVVEAPWDMYHRARPRRHPSPLPPDASPTEILYRQKAESELHRIEVFFLLCTTLSPFIGAYLLRHVLLAIAGRDVLSWFSTTLFVLATGMRPWSQVLDRLQNRVDALHDIVHIVPPPSQRHAQEIADLRAQVEALQKSVLQARQETDDAYDYIDEAIEATEKNVKRHEKRCDKNEQRMRDLEVVVDTLKGKLKRMPLSPLNLKSTSKASRVWDYLFPSQVSPPKTKLQYPPSASPKYSMYSFTQSSDRLESIPEHGVLSECASVVETSVTLPVRIAGSAVKGVWGLATLPMRLTMQVVFGARRRD